MLLSVLLDFTRKINNILAAVERRGMRHRGIFFLIDVGVNCAAGSTVTFEMKSIFIVNRASTFWWVRSVKISL